MAQNCTIERPVDKNGKVAWGKEEKLKENEGQ